MPRSLKWMLLSLLLSACAGREEADLHFHAAASLGDAARELCEVWNAGDSLRAVPVLAGSSTLARQIVQGAPASVFLSASSDWMNHVEENSERIVERRELLSNRLALIVPVGNPIRIGNAGDLAGRALQRLAMGDPGHVPAGIYARAWLQEAGLWESVKDRLLPARDVRAALAYVERGEADAGIVYASDALAAGIEPVTLADPPRDMPILYPIGLLAGTEGEEPGSGARRFFDWLAGPEAREIFVKHGFIPLDGNP